MTRGRPYEFPNADARSPKDPNDFCSRDKVLGLYNQEHKTKRVRMSPDVEVWFEMEARKRKWVACHFSDAGCTLIAYLIHGQDAEKIQSPAEKGNVVSLDAAARRRGK